MSDLVSGVEELGAGASSPAPRPRRRFGRRAVIVASCLVAIIAGGGATAAVALSDSNSGSASVEEPVDVSTEPVQRGTLSGSTSAVGKLVYAGSRALASSFAGVITWLPTPGAVVNLGEGLFAVDNKPVYLFHGALPAWRGFEVGMDDGPDVQALEASLTALGFFDREPDGEFDWFTKEAIFQWQKATGQEQTGAIELGRVIFSPENVRVSEVTASVGAQIGPGAEPVSVSNLAKLVQVDLKLADQKLAQVGAAVGIDLPGGTSTTGKVSSVGTPVEKDGASGGKEIVIPVVVSLDDQAAAGDLQQASVTVNFPTETREDVLSVPVGALLALDGTRFGVEVVQKDGTTKRIPVETGLFASGRVEVSGKGLAEGQEVVVPGQ